MIAFALPQPLSPAAAGDPLPALLTLPQAADKDGALFAALVAQNAQSAPAPAPAATTRQSATGAGPALPFALPPQASPSAAAPSVIAALFAPAQEAIAPEPPPGESEFAGVSLPVPIVSPPVALETGGTKPEPLPALTVIPSPAGAFDKQPESSLEGVPVADAASIPAPPARVQAAVPSVPQEIGAPGPLEPSAQPAGGETPAPPPPQGGSVSSIVEPVAGEPVAPAQPPLPSQDAAVPAAEPVEPAAATMPGGPALSPASPRTASSPRADRENPAASAPGAGNTPATSREMPPGPTVPAMRAVATGSIAVSAEAAPPAQGPVDASRTPTQPPPASAANPDAPERHASLGDNSQVSDDGAAPAPARVAGTLAAPPPSAEPGLDPLAVFVRTALASAQSASQRQPSVVTAQPLPAAPPAPPAAADSFIAAKPAADNSIQYLTGESGGDNSGRDPGERNPQTQTPAPRPSEQRPDALSSQPARAEIPAVPHVQGLDLRGVPNALQANAAASFAPPAPDASFVILPAAPKADAPLRFALTNSTSSPVAGDVAALAIRIAHKSSLGENRFDIQLDPPELGGIRVRLEVDARGGAQAQLSVDRPQTLELLTRDAAALERALKDAGLDLAGNLSFSLKGEGQARERNRDHNGRYATAPAGEADGQEPILHWQGRVLGETGRLDIRV